jgi:hypothetical protein
MNLMVTIRSMEIMNIGSLARAPDTKPECRRGTFADCHILDALAPTNPQS